MSGPAQPSSQMPFGLQPGVDVLRGMFSLFPFLTAVGTVVGAIYLSAWVLPVGLALWCLLVYAYGPRRIGPLRRVWRERAALIEALPPRLRSLALEIQASVAGIKGAIANADSSTQVMLAGLDVEVDELGQAAERLLRSAGRLHGYLQHNDTEELAKRQVALQARIQATQDDLTRSQLQEAAAELAETQQTQEWLELQLERVSASVQNLVSSLSSVHSQVVKLTSSDTGSAEPFERGTVEHLSEVRGSIAALQEVIETRVGQE